VTSIFGTTGNYNIDAARGGAYQPINYVISQTAANDGTATFLFDAVALSNTWTLTINCATAPDTARFTAATGGTQFGQFKGSNSWGPLQLQGGDRLQVTSTGLVPGTLYQMAGYGYANIVNDPQIVYPDSYADSVTTSTEQLYLANNEYFGGSPTTFTVTVQPTWRSIYFVGISTSGAPGITVTAVGQQSGFNYNVISVPYVAGTGSTTQFVYRIPIVNGLDTTILFTCSGATPYTFYYGADLANIDVAVYPEGTFNVTPTNTSSTPLWVESVTGSTTQVTNPTATGSFLNTGLGSVFGAKSTQTSNSATFTIPLTTSGGSNFRSVWIISTYANTFSAATGNVSGLTYVPYAITSPFGSGYAWRIPLLYGIDTAINIGFYYAGAPTTWTYWYGYDTSPTNIAVSPQSSTGLLVTTNPNYTSTTKVTGSSNFSTAVNNSSGLQIASLTTTGTTSTQIIAAPGTGNSLRIQSVSMYYTGTASTTPVIGRMLSGTTTLFTFMYPYQNTIIANGQVLTANTALNVIAGSTTTTVWTVTYDILANINYT